MQAQSEYAEKLEKQVPLIKEALTKLDSVDFNRMDAVYDEHAQLIKESKRETQRDLSKAEGLLGEINDLDSRLSQKQALFDRMAEQSKEIDRLDHQHQL